MVCREVRYPKSGFDAFGDDENGCGVINEDKELADVADEGRVGWCVRRLSFDGGVAECIVASGCVEREKPLSMARSMVLCAVLPGTIGGFEGSRACTAEGGPLSIERSKLLCAVLIFSSSMHPAGITVEAGSGVGLSMLSRVTEVVETAGCLN